MLASHCIHERGSFPKEPENSKFSLGRYNLTTTEAGSLDVEVSRFILHPEWSLNQFENRGDIAIAVLKTKIDYSQFIRPICLNTEDLFNFYNKTGTVAGWGATEDNPRKASDIALEINIKIYGTRDCLVLDKDLAFIITETSFCAGNRNGTGACVGKSLPSHKKNFYSIIEFLCSSLSIFFPLFLINFFFPKVTQVAVCS